MSEQSTVTSGPYVDSRSSLTVLVKAIWLVMKKRDVPNFERILEFLELTHKQVPGLLCYRHHAKLSTGLRGKIVLHMFEEKKPLLDILTALNCHFPPVLDETTVTRREAFKVQQCKIHFRKLALRMIRDETFRQNYVKNTLHVEYGDKFMDVLEKLLWEFLRRLQNVLNHQVQQTTELPVVDEDHLSSTPIQPVALNFSDVTQETSISTKKLDNPKTNNATSSAIQEEDLNPLQGQYEEQCNTKNKSGNSSCEDSSLSISQDLSQQTASGRTIHFINSPTYTENKPQPPYFSIFGFDNSQSSKVIQSEKLSPPDPLQSQSLDLDLDPPSDPGNRHDVMGHDSQVTGVSQMHCPPISIHEPKSLHNVFRGSLEGQGDALAQEIMSWRYQPRVHLTKLPLNIITMYLDKVADSQQSQGEPVADSDSWFWLCSDPTDNDSNDPDYLPGHSLGEQRTRIQPKRGPRFSSLQ